MRIGRFIMIFVYSLLSIGAFISGGMLIIDPSGKGMGLSIELLKYSPFHTYMIPGILLFCAIGLLQFVSAIQLKRKGPYLKKITLVSAVSMLIWIVVQLTMIGYVFFLQAIILFISIVELIYSIYLPKDNH